MSNFWNIGQDLGNLYNYILLTLYIKENQSYPLPSQQGLNKPIVSPGE